VGFRDEEGAKRARAEALSRELADRERRLAELDAALADKEAKLADKARLLEEAREEADDLSRASARLDALRDRAPTFEAEAPVGEGGADGVARRAVELASVSVFGNIDVLQVGLLGAFPTMYAAFYLGVSQGGLAGWLPPVALVSSMAALRWGGRMFARRLWEKEAAWARSRPYGLRGYPELLGTPPSSMRSTVSRLDGDSHQVLELALGFADDADAPADLGELLTSFDEELTPGVAVTIHDRHRFMGPARDDPPYPTFHRPSPVSYRTTKAGSRFVQKEHNRAVQRWVRRIDRDLLQPLHTRHGLAWAELRLR
jgi:hypothetical protein